MNFEYLHKKWGVCESSLDNWYKQVKPDDVMIDRVEVELNQRECSALVLLSLAPESYIFRNKGLLDDMWKIELSVIKQLDEGDYQQHLKQLISKNESSILQFPFDLFCHETFVVLRHSKRKSEIGFCRQMFFKKKQGLLFIEARHKLQDLAATYEHSIVPIAKAG